ncbi:hypothetical protein [Clostridium botulinum]|uniref:hypothetical protein n=1 Tax=Clostridium botulinum TaxID=1491 RepID=UPI000D124DD0|nr:hypothetical protein [Clostridium botulinum]AVQ47144.1 hypothetical protein C7M60_15705 [Clostridium botulinum]AVQ50619.1 hypothetical protein C7M58_15280 [Clostridium botulinum]
MLKVLKCKEKEVVKFQFDIYVPINIKFGSWDISEDQTIYWRTGDFKKSLIEIGIGEKTGDIHSITLILAENVYKLNNFDNGNSNIIEGMPKIKLDNLVNKTYNDKKGDINVYVDRDNIYILFSKNEVSSFIKNYNVEFGLDNDGMINMIIIRNVKNSEKKILEQALL